MDISADFVNKHKNKILNLGLVALALFAAYQINLKGEASFKALSAKVKEETKKNGVFEDLARLDKESKEYKGFFSPADTGLIMTSFNNLTRGLDIEITSIRPLNEEKREDYVEVRFDLAFRAKGYHALGRFIQAIEDFKNIYVIDQLSVNPEPNGELSVRITVKAFYLKP